MSSDTKPQNPPPPPAAAPKGPPPPKNPGKVTFTVDGREVVAAPGTNMIDAAKQVGVEIPYYCYHPRLSVAANCRMCLVESSAAGKLVPACQTPIAEGMAVKTSTEKVKDEQRAVMEFLLLNHPVDCSICDQAGECKLQDYYARYDHKPSRLDGDKVLKNKRKILGPTVVLDQERCIMCTRCVRFMNEVAKEPQLGVFGRGSHERIDVFPDGGGLTSNYSGNTVDICPVGALLNRDFRFRARAWFLSSTPSVCTGCSRGCSVYADFMGQDVYRLRPRENDAINASWMCDQGRLTYKAIGNDRLLSARGAKGQGAPEVTRLDAVAAAARLLVPGQVTVVISAAVSNEDAMAALAVARDVLKVQTVYLTGRADGAQDKLLMTSDKNPNRAGVEAIASGFGLTLKPVAELRIEAGRVAWMIGAEASNAEALAQTLSGFRALVLQAVNDGPLARAAEVLLPAASHVEDEGTFTQVAGITQRFRRAFPPRGDAWPHWRWAVELSRALGVDVPHGSARDVFKAHAPRVEKLSTFDWDREAPLNQERRGISPLPTAADGRPPGYREVGAPRVRGI